MKPEEVKAEWVKDLRSGEFLQTTQELSNLDGYCCLGVGCKTLTRLGAMPTGFVWNDDLGVLRSTEPAEPGRRSNGEIALDGFLTWDTMLPEPVVKALGILDADQNVLAENNDTGSTFEEIADMIEADAIVES